MNLIPRKRGNGSELASLQTSVNRLFNEFFTGIDMPLAEKFGEWAPALDLAETDTEILVKTEIPGIDPKDMDVSIAGEVLTVKGEKKSEVEEKGKTWHRTERNYGAFQRSINLPCPVYADRVKAEYKNGVLSIMIPKREEARPKPIKVNVK
ncbi:MAG: Hsp20/alpha crystallin family protein [Planctomycetes bacterium]|nr:Hsp20/alpha crystallin family protein [Planctomycetota bacterium]MBI3843697.1 Hsp20/alpha crystallin family protein [Planctomycetota bacterium]